MREFWDDDKRYTFVRRYVDLCTSRCFRRVEVVGELSNLGEGVHSPKSLSVNILRIKGCTWRCTPLFAKY